MRDPAPIRLDYANRRPRTGGRLAAAFTAVAVVLLLGSGSLAWALLVSRHR